MKRGEGQGCILESSSDLQTWSPVIQTTTSDPILTYSIDPTAETHLFYRLRIENPSSP